MKFQTIIDNHSMEMEFSNSLNLLSIEFIEDLEIDCIQLSYNSYSLILNDKSHYLSVTPYFHGFKVIVDHHTHLVQIQNELDILLETFGMHDSKSKHAGEIYAQIPGLVGQVFVKKGDIVEVNQKLFILEAMKMENEIDSPVSGTINHIHCKPGDKVEKGNIIMEIRT